MTSDATQLDHRLRPAAGEPEGALVLFHGRGADEHDLFPLLDALDPERRLQGYTPRGPRRCSR
jgi:phospholipase/carboxylesterase